MQTANNIPLPIRSKKPNQSTLQNAANSIIENNSVSRPLINLPGAGAALNSKKTYADNGS